MSPAPISNLKTVLEITIFTLFLILIIGCENTKKQSKARDQQKADSINVHKKTNVSDDNEDADLLDRFIIVKNGMSKDSVLKIFENHKAGIEMESEVITFGPHVKLWSHQSPKSFGRRVVITFDELGNVKNKQYYEDYYGIPSKPGYVDTLQLFKANE